MQKRLTKENKSVAVPSALLGQASETARESLRGHRESSDVAETKRISEAAERVSEATERASRHPSRLQR